MMFTLLSAFIITACGCVESARLPRDAHSRPCVTPNMEAGQCIAAYRCHSIWNTLLNFPKKGIVDTPKPNSEQEEQVEFFRNSRCKGEYEFSVCCPTAEEPQCGHSPEERIVGGRISAIDAFAWLAIVEYKKANATELACGGSLVSKKHVLTAASCLQAGTPTSVRLGEHDTSKDVDCDSTPDGSGKECADPAVSIPVSRVTFYPEYDAATGSHDLALITLEKDVNFTNFVTPVCLPGGAPEKDFRISGWSLHQNTTPHALKHQGFATVVPQDVCRQILGTNHITSEHVCAIGKRNEGSNTVDYGGPLTDNSNLKSHRIIGVASPLKKDLGDDGELVVYTNVFNHIDWIIKVLTQ